MQRKIPQYEGEVEYWECSRCREWLPRESYYRHPQRWNGISTECKKCHRKTVVETRDPENTRRINREYMGRFRAREPEKHKARYTLDNAVRDGKLTKQPCELCQCGAEAHHEDYSKPLEVKWLCQKHHSEVHNGK